MKTKLYVANKAQPMRIEDAEGMLITVHTHRALTPAQNRVLKDHLRQVAVTFTQFAEYANKR